MMMRKWCEEGKKKPWGYEGGLFRARLLQAWLDWHLIATFSIFRVGGFSYQAPLPHFFDFSRGQGQFKECSIVRRADVESEGLLEG